MHIDEFRACQRQGAKNNLYSLIMSCRDRFLNSASLLELRSPAIEELASFGVASSVDVWPLLNPFSVLTERYLDQFFTPQKELFATQYNQQDELWSRYFYQILLPHLVLDNEVVRNTLRAVRALPSKQPEEAPTALALCFSEMTLPHTRPVWVAENTAAGYWAQPEMP